jgi:hypothetical protein
LKLTEYINDTGSRVDALETETIGDEALLNNIIKVYGNARLTINIRYRFNNYLACSSNLKCSINLKI